MITVPKFSGYKTLIVNAAVILYGLLAVIFPKLAGHPAPDADTLGILVDQGEGALIAVVGLVNMVLRLMTTGPAGPMRKPDPAGFSSGDGEPGIMSSGTDAHWPNSTAAPVHREPVRFLGHQDERMRRELEDALRGLGLADRKAARLGMAYGSGPATFTSSLRQYSQHPAAKPASVPAADAPEPEPFVMPPCTWPDCACHMRCPDYEPTVGAALATDRATTPPDELEAAQIWGNSYDPDEVLAALDELRLNGLPAQEVAKAKASKLAIVRAVYMALFLPFAALSIAVLPACGAITEVSAVAQAETLEQRAFALYGTFVVLEERAADIVEDRRVPVETRKRIQDLDKITKPAADIVLNAAKQLAEARTAYQHSTGTADKVAALSTSLAGALATLQPRITAFVQLIEGVKR